MTDERADKGFFDKLRERVRADRPPSPTEVRKRFASSEISELHRRFEDYPARPWRFGQLERSKRRRNTK